MTTHAKITTLTTNAGITIHIKQEIETKEGKELDEIKWLDAMSIMKSIQETHQEFLETQQ
jgi:hypothetical protein